MGVQVSWDNPEKTVLLYELEGRWTWDEFHAAVADAFAMTASVPHTVDTISHFHRGTPLPANAMFHFRRVMLAAPPNRGINVIVGGSSLVRTMASLFSKAHRLLGRRLLVCATLEEARETLDMRRTRAVR